MPIETSQEICAAERKAPKCICFQLLRRSLNVSAYSPSTQKIKNTKTETETETEKKQKQKQKQKQKT